MSTDSKDQEIIIYSSETPILRGGLSNILFFLLFISLIFLNQLLNEFSVTLFSKIIIFLITIFLILKIYSHSISRLQVKDDQKLIMVGPISKTIIATSEIEKAEIYGIPSSMVIFIMLKIKNVILPKFYFIVSLSSNCGSYLDTKIRLKEILMK